MSSTATSVPEPASGPSGFVRNSTVRFAADASGLLLGTISSVVTARVLGPTGKGTLAALTFVTLLMVQCCTLGLGDAAVVRVGQQKASPQQALSSSLTIVVASSFVGALLVLVYAAVQLPLAEHGVWAAVVTACVTVVVSTAAQLLIFIVYATHRIMAVSLLTIAMSLITTAGVVIFCSLLDLGVFGGVLASLAAGACGFAFASMLLRQSQLALRPRLDRSYIRPALTFGVRTQLATVLAYSSARVDLLLVYALASQTQAGYYSVALTLGTITGFIAVAVSYASFPSMTQMADADALRLATQLARVAFGVGALLAVGLSVVVSGLIPLLVGDAYQGAVTPAIILLFGNVLWGGQWMLSRALAALGDPELLFRSFAFNLAIMVAADLILIPRLDAVGAAVGSVLGPAAGLTLCLWAYREKGLNARQFIPQVADLRRVHDLIRRRGRAVDT